MKFRAILEGGTRAFVSFVHSYFKHDCQIVCRFSELNVAGVAHSFGLLRLPQMPELKKCRQNLKECFEGRSDIRTSVISFKDQKAEESRQKKIKKKMNEAQGVVVKRVYWKDDEEDEELKPKNKRKRKLTDSEELQRGASILKKFKKGKLSKKDLEELI